MSAISNVIMACSTKNDAVTRSPVVLGKSKSLCAADNYSRKVKAVIEIFHLAALSMMTRNSLNYLHYSQREIVHLPQYNMIHNYY